MQNIYEILEKMGIAIERVNVDSSFGNLTIYAEYEEKKKKINLYLPALEKIKNQFNGYDIEEIALAHELYHILNKKKEPKHIQEARANLFAKRWLTKV